MQKILSKPLQKSGIPVACKICLTPLHTNNYEKCSICGAYLCESCKKEHNCK